MKSFCSMTSGWAIPGVLFLALFWVQAAAAAPLIRNAVIDPAQVTFESDPILSMAISTDGKRIVYTTGPETATDLWLGAIDPTESVLPRKLTADPFSESFPAFSKDGRQIAYVGTSHDVKGDIYLLDITDLRSRPVRLTGRDTRDGAPCFSPDGERLYFHQSGTDDSDSRIVYIDLNRSKAGGPGAAPVSDTGLKGAFPALSAAHHRLVFISYAASPAGILYVSDPDAPDPKRLTTGNVPVLFPAWSADGRSVFYTTFPADTDDDGVITVKDRPAIQKVDPETGYTFLMTPLTEAAITPCLSGEKLYFLSDRGGPNNCWSQPSGGRIALMDSPKNQLALADAMENRVPYSPALALLSHCRVVDSFSGAPDQAARAAYAMGNIYRSLSMKTAALDAYDHVLKAYPKVMPEAALCAIMKLAVGTELVLNNETDKETRTAQILESTARMAKLAENASPLVRGKAAAEQAKLMQQTAGIPYIKALLQLDAALSIPDVPDRVAAEALLEKGALYGRIGQRDQLLPIYLSIMKRFPEEKPFADQAVEEAIDLYTATFSTSDVKENILFLRTLAEDNVVKNPILTRGAINRIGDIYHAAGDYDKAKAAYTEVTKRFPGLTSQTAAARLALAEIFFHEERFRRALDLYEKELAVRPFDDRIYQLARRGYIQKSVSAGEYLYRIGEIRAAAKTFRELTDYDPAIVAAHRGYIKCADAAGKIEATIAAYQAMLDKDPENPVLLYATGLALTYRNDRQSLLAARALIQKALKLNGQVAYFHQTLGYIDEVRQTVYGDKGTLESALVSYKKAYFLNSAADNPDNAANLLLNIGNTAFALGRYQQAWPYFEKRLAANKPFDHIEAEILFYQKLGRSAYYAGHTRAAREAFEKGLALMDTRLSPENISDLLADKFDKRYRFSMDTVVTPALKHPALEKKAKALFARMAQLNTALFQCLQTSAAPPDPSWETFREKIKAIEKSQKPLCADIAALYEQLSARPDNPTPLTVSDLNDAYAVLFKQLDDTIRFPDRYIILKTEMLNQLALVLQEDGDYQAATDTYEAAFRLNKALGLSENLSLCRRNAAYNKYLNSGQLSGDSRTLMLKAAAADFTAAMALVEAHGVPPVKEEKKQGLLSVGTALSINEINATRAAFGFTAAQEIRLCRAFLTRIHMALNEFEPAFLEIEKQLEDYPPDEPIGPADMHGISLLCHNAGLLSAARQDPDAASRYFQRAARLCLAMDTPVSAAINLADMVNMISLKTAANDPAVAGNAEDLLALDRKVLDLVAKHMDYLDPLMMAAWHNHMGVYLMPASQNSPVTARQAITGMLLKKAATVHFLKGIDLLEKQEKLKNRSSLVLGASLYLNMAASARILGEDARSRSCYEKALKVSEFAMLPQIKWRALAGLNRLAAALETLKSLTFLEAGCGPTEITGAFGGNVAQLVKNGQVEEGFNLAEKISEIERFNRTAFVLQSVDASGRRLLLSTYERLLTIRDLEAKIGKARGEEKELLAEDIRQEKTLFSEKAGQSLENMPEIVKSPGTRKAQEDLVILTGLALNMEAVADRMVREAGVSIAEILAPETEVKTKTFQAMEKERGRLSGQYWAFLRQCRQKRQSGVFADVLTLAAPEPAEAIDIMAYLPEDGGLLRVFKTGLPKTPYIMFTLTMDDLDGTFVENRSALDFPEDMPYVAGEEIFELPFSGRHAFALNGTHLLRCIVARKPFKKNILFQPRPLALPMAGFQVLAADEPDKGAQTLVMGETVMKTLSVPVRQSDAPMDRLMLASATGPYTDLPLTLAGLPDLSLAFFTRKMDTNAAYLAGHMAPIFGCPSIVLSETADMDDAFVQAFFAAYADASAAGALSKAAAGMPDTAAAAGIRVLGYCGMDKAETVSFAKARFAAYIREGRRLFAEKAYADARIRFENAMAIARQVPDYTPYLPALLTFARESAWQEGSTAKAEAFARELASILEKTKPDTEAHADALLRHGLILSKMEKYDAAIPLMDDALEILTHLEIDHKQAEALTSLGIVLEDASHYASALKRFESAAMLSETMEKTELMAAQYDHIGRIYDLRLSNYARAILYYQKSLEIRLAVKDAEKVAQDRLNIGRCRRLTGDFAGADALYAAALETIKDAPRLVEIKVKILIEQANNAWFQARYQAAFDLEKEAYQLSLANDLALMEIVCKNTEGLIWWTLGENDKALAALRSALEKAESMGKREDEKATTLNNIGLVQREKGAYADALDTFDRALEIDTRIQSRWAVAYDCRNKGLTLLKMQKPGQAVPLFQKALDESMAIGNRINAAKALLGLASALALTGKSDAALETYGQAFDLSRQMGIRETMWRSLYGLAGLKLETGDAAKTKEAEAHLYAAMDIIEGMRTDIRIEQLKDSFIENKRAVYETLIRHLADSGRPAAALDVAERSRARNFIDLLGNQRLDLKNAVHQDLYDRRSFLKSRLETRERQMAAADTPEEKAFYQSELQKLKLSDDNLMLEIQAKHPQLASLVTVDPLTAEQVLALLDPGVCLLSYYLLPDEVFCWIIYPEKEVSRSIRLVRLPAGRTALARDIFSYRRTIQNLEPYTDQSRRLFSTLLAPVFSEMAASGISPAYIGVIPHGPLHYLSFATLFDGQSYFIDAYPLFYLPSASVLKFTRERRKKDKNTQVLAVGNPDLGNPALDLPFSEHEVETIKWNFPKITVLTRDRATESWVGENIHRFGIIHIASHGEFDTVNPLFSAIKLAKDRTDDGNLQAGEIFGLDINADLVVLSACQTGLGKITAGDDVIGLNRSFFYAGTHAVISSLWRVSDISTAILVKQFYRMYIDRNKAESLRHAMRHVRQQYPHPGYWGAFNLVGDYQ